MREHHAPKIKANLSLGADSFPIKPVIQLLRSSGLAFALHGETALQELPFKLSPASEQSGLLL